MKKLFCILAFGTIYIHAQVCQSGQYWLKTFGGTGRDYPYSVQQTTDGGYVVAGYSNSFGDGGTDIWILKLNADVTVAWQKTYGGDGEDIATAIQQTADGGYILAGYTSSFGSGIFDYLVIKLDSNGNIVWQKTYGGESYDEAWSIQQTCDGGYIVVGYTMSFGGGFSDYWIVRLDSNGDIVWQKTYGGISAQFIRSIIQTNDGGFIMAGDYSANMGDPADYCVVKLDVNGNVMWDKVYRGGSTQQAFSIKQTSEGGYIVVGYTQFLHSTMGVLPADIWILKLDTVGSVLWEKTYGGSESDIAFLVQQTSDEGYIVVGATNSYGAGGDIILLKLNSSGAVLWQKTYGENGNDRAETIQQTSDGGYIVAGTFAKGTEQEDYLIMKLDSEGNVPNCSIIGTSDVVVSSIEPVVQTPDPTIHSTNATIDDANITVQDTLAEENTVCFWIDPDSDSDGIPDVEDNCPDTPNGPDGGTCTIGDIGNPCMSDGECGETGFCSMNQEDTDGDGIGDACEFCECDVSNDGQCTPIDALCTFEKYLLLCPTTCGNCEDICCDVTKDDQCTPADALCRFQEYLGIHPNCFD